MFLSFSEDSNDSVTDIDGFLDPVPADIDDVDTIAGVVLDVDDDVEVAADANVDADADADDADVDDTAVRNGFNLLDLVVARFDEDLDDDDLDFDFEDLDLDDFVVDGDSMHIGVVISVSLFELVSPLILLSYKDSSSLL